MIQPSLITLCDPTLDWVVTELGACLGSVCFSVSLCVGMVDLDLMADFDLNMSTLCPTLEEFERMIYF